MGIIDSHATRPIHVGSTTHRPVKLVGMQAPIATKPVPEAPRRTRRRVTADQHARLARALKGNHYLHLAR